VHERAGRKHFDLVALTLSSLIDLQRGRPWRGAADRGAGGGGAEDGDGGARGARVPRRHAGVDAARVPDVAVRGAGRRRRRRGEGGGQVRGPPGLQLAHRRLTARGQRPGGADRRRGVGPLQAGVAGVGRRHGRQRAPGTYIFTSAFCSVRAGAPGC